MILHNMLKHIYIYIYIYTYFKSFFGYILLCRESMKEQNIHVSKQNK